MLNRLSRRLEGHAHDHKIPELAAPRPVPCLPEQLDEHAEEESVFGTVRRTGRGSDSRSMRSLFLRCTPQRLFALMCGSSRGSQAHGRAAPSGGRSGKTARKAGPGLHQLLLPQKNLHEGTERDENLARSAGPSTANDS